MDAKTIIDQAMSLAGSLAQHYNMLKGAIHAFLDLVSAIKSGLRYCKNKLDQPPEGEPDPFQQLQALLAAL